MTERFLFRMTDYRNLPTFLNDGYLFAPNFRYQPQYTISAQNINSRRGHQYLTPHNESLHDFVPFYFAPLTSMAYSIHCNNVQSYDLSGNFLGNTQIDHIAFLVYHLNYLNINFMSRNQIPIWFSDMACNTDFYTLKNDPTEFRTHIKWDLFDEYPIIANLPQIGYNGVCRYNFSNDKNPKYANRSSERMAEFLIKNYVPINFLSCIVAKNHRIQSTIEEQIGYSGYNIPVYVNAEFYPS